MRWIAAICLACSYLGRAAAADLELFVGTYTRSEGGSQGVYRVRFDAATGSFAGPAELVARFTDPTWLAGDAQRRRLYAVGRGKAPELGGFAVHGAGRVDELGRVGIAGRNPCDALVVGDGAWVATATYAGGTVEVYRITADGSPGARMAEIRLAHASGADPKRQEAPHPHGVTALGDQLLVPDLGADRVYRFRVDPAAGTLAPCPLQPWLELPPGTGPRQAAVSVDGRQVFVVGELASTLTVCAVRDGILVPEQRLELLPHGWLSESLAAAVVVHPDGRTVYATNRGQDAVAVLRREPGEATWSLRGHVPCAGRTPRHALIAPDGRFLLVALQDSHAVQVFSIDPATGMPSPLATPALAVGQPTCLRFL